MIIEYINHPMLASAAAVACSALLDCVVVFVVCFVFIGMPLGCLLGTWLAIRSRRRDFGDKACPTTINQVAELVKHDPPFRVYLAAQLCLGYRLLFLKRESNSAIKIFYILGKGKSTGFIDFFRRNR